MNRNSNKRTKYSEKGPHTFKRNQVELLKVKSIIKEFQVKNPLDALNKRLDTAEEEISEPAVRSEGITETRASHSVICRLATSALPGRY